MMNQSGKNQQHKSPPKEWIGDSNIGMSTTDSGKDEKIMIVKYHNKFGGESKWVNLMDYVRLQGSLSVANERIKELESVVTSQEKERQSTERFWKEKLAEIQEQNEIAKEALDKIRDPRKRHSEPDKYTELGCVMNIADEAMKKIEGEA